MNRLRRHNELILGLGFAVLLLWRPIVSRFMIDTFEVQMFGSLGLLAASLLVVMAALGWVKTLSFINWIVPLFMFATPLCGLFFLENETICIVAVFLGEFGRGVFLLKWMNHYSSLDMKTAGKMVLSSFVLASFAAVLFVSINILELPFVILISFLPLALPLLIQELEDDENNSVVVIRDKPINNKKVVLIEICVLVFMLVLFQEFEDGIRYSTTMATLLGGILKVLLPLVAIPLFIGTKHNKQMTLTAQYIILFAAIILLGLAFLGRSGVIVVAILITLARESLRILLLLNIVNAARFSERPNFVIGTHYGAYSAAIMLGTIASEVFFHLNSSLSSISEDVFLNVTFFVALSVILFIVVVIVSTLHTYKYAEQTSPVCSESPLYQKLSLLREKYNLTGRETEIAEYLYKGRNTKFIAETLVISKNTVRFHCKHLYEKLGIHSKQDLITIIDSLEP